MMNQQNMEKFQFSLLLCFYIFLSFGFLNACLGQEQIGVYELNKGNFTIKFTNWGATIMSLVIPDKHGKLADVVLGYDKVKTYKNDSVYFGAIVGRVANRIGGAQFTLDGKHYKLIANEGKNMLHGGLKGFSDVVWQVKKYTNKDHTPRIVFSYHSSDGEEGFPGNLVVTVAYKILKDNELSVKMKAKSLNKATPVNLAQHAYWNLGGHNSGDVLSQEIKISASHYTPVDAGLIPTGKILPVKGTPYDLLESVVIKSKINELPNGYDMNYVVDGGSSDSSHKMKKVAVVYDKKSGRKMQLLSNQPGVQFYTGNYLKDVKGKDGAVYQAHAGLCLETQGFPDAVNHPEFPSVIVRPGQSYEHHMLFKFSTH